MIKMRHNHLQSEKLSRYVEAQIAAGVFRPGMQLPPLKEWADTFGLSESSARRSLLKLCESGLLELRHGQGTFVRRRREDNEENNLQRRISVVTTRSTDSDGGTYCGRIIRGIQQRAETQHTQLLLNFIPYETCTVQKLIQSSTGCDGLILVGCYDCHLDDVPEGIPVVGANMHCTYGGKVSTVDLDPYRAAELAADYFRKHGKKRVHVFSHDETSRYFRTVFRLRATTFLECWREYGEGILHTLQPSTPDDLKELRSPEDGYLWDSGARTRDCQEAYHRETGRILTDDYCIFSIDGRQLGDPDFVPVATAATDYFAMGEAAFDECLERVRNPGRGMRRIFTHVFSSIP